MRPDDNFDEKTAGEKDGFYLVTKEAKAEGESDTKLANAETESAAASSAAGQTSASTPVGVNSQKSSGGAQLLRRHIYSKREHQKNSLAVMLLRYEDVLGE